MGSAPSGTLYRFKREGSCVALFSCCRDLSERGSLLSMHPLPNVCTDPRDL